MEQPRKNLPPSPLNEPQDFLEEENEGLQELHDKKSAKCVDRRFSKDFLVISSFGHFLTRQFELLASIRNVVLIAFNRSCSFLRRTISDRLVKRGSPNSHDGHDASNARRSRE